jgi:hypothetical protein
MFISSTPVEVQNPQSFPMVNRVPANEFASKLRAFNEVRVAAELCQNTTLSGLLKEKLGNVAFAFVRIRVSDFQFLCDVHVLYLVNC